MRLEPVFCCSAKMTGSSPCLSFDMFVLFCVIYVLIISYDVSYSSSSFLIVLFLFIMILILGPPPLHHHHVLILLLLASSFLLICLCVFFVFLVFLVLSSSSSSASSSSCSLSSSSSLKRFEGKGSEANTHYANNALSPYTQNLLGFVAPMLAKKLFNQRQTH